MWGMDEDCEYERSSYQVKEDPRWSQTEDRLDILVGTDINTCRETAINELEILEFAPTITQAERSGRLLYLLQRDILGTYLGGLIMERKFLRDAFYQNELEFPSYALQFAGAPVAQSTLVVFAVSATLFAIAILGYLLYFAIVESPQRQRAWLASFVIWIVLDFALVSTLEALVTNIFIPRLIVKDMTEVNRQTAEVSAKIAQNLIAPPDNFTKHPAESTTTPELSPRKSPRRSPGGRMLTPVSPTHKSPRGSPRSPTGKISRKGGRTLPFLDVGAREELQAFNAANFFSVANRVSKYFGDYNESRFVQAYTSYHAPGEFVHAKWMRPLFHRIQQVDESHVKRHKSQPPGSAHTVAPFPSIFADDSFGLFCYTVLKNFLECSFFVQDTLLQLVLTSLIFFLLLLHVQLYNAMPVLTLVPTAIVVGLIIIYVLFRLGRYLGGVFNRWNEKRVTPFHVSTIRVLENDEFIAEANLDDEDELFQNFNAPVRMAPGYAAEAKSNHGSPMKHDRSADYVHPFDEAKDIQPAEIRTPQRQRESKRDDRSSSSDYSSGEEKSDSSESTTDSEPSPVRQATHRSPKKATNANDMHVSDVESKAAAHPANKLKSHAVLAYRDKSPDKFSSPKTNFYVPNRNGASQSAIKPTRAERLMSLANDDPRDHRAASLYKPKSSTKK